MNDINRTQELVKQLNVYRNEYYNLNRPSVSNVTYDKLFDELSNLEKETGYILSNSPTQTVGYEVKSKLQKVEHPIPLKSLDKTKSIDELVKWCNNKDILLMLKADGLTIELVYENGNLIQASTRGNSFVGEDVTHNAKVFKNIPLTIPFKGLLRIAGEAIIHKNDFDIINSKLLDEDKYATPRNLVAGSVRQLDSKICSQREVYFYAFTVLECDEELSDSKHEQFRWLADQGFWTIFYMYGDISNIELSINRMIELTKEKFVPIDGMVVTYDSVKYSKSLGETAHHPLHSLAWKAKDESETTTLKGIEWSVGRTGVITPVAIFDTVILDNTEVSRASVHNLSICEELELGFGDSISIIKANQIIPQIEENFTRSNNLIIPETCPVCNGKTVISQNNESKFLYCTNEDCKAKLLYRTKHMASRDALNIEGLNEQTIQKFIDRDYITKPWNVFDITIEEILKCEGFAKKSAEKLYDNIQNARNCDFDKAIYASGIELVGRKVSKDIAREFGSYGELTNRNNNLRNRLSNIEGIGDLTIDSFIDNMYLLNELISYLNIQKPEEKKPISNTNSPFAGKKVYATGTFAGYKKEELKSILEGLGAEFTSGYAKSLDYLVEGSLKSSSKVDKALKDGVKVLKENEFLKLIKKDIK